MKPYSLKRQFIVLSGISLVLVMSFAAIFVYLSFIEQIKGNAREQLELHIYNMLSVAKFYEKDISLPEIMYNPQFNTLNSGLWSMVLNQEKRPVWHSLSMEKPFYGVVLPHQAGQWKPGSIEHNGVNYLTMSYMVAWQSNEETINFYLIIGETNTKNRDAVHQLLVWLTTVFVGITVVLLLGQYLALRYSIRPIISMEREIEELEAGGRDRLSRTYPVELEGVERNINALIDKEHLQRERYRESMANLAHSLKTPMTIISSEVVQYPENKNIQNAVRSVNDGIEYQLRRAVISGHTLLSRGVPVRDVVDAILDAMDKIHTRKNISSEVSIASNVEFFGDENDLMEVLGNLIDNAYRYAKEHVLVSVASVERGINISVDDDGGGLNEEDCIEIFKRGIRLDQRNQGQGIGLAVSADIVKSYEGEIWAERSHLGGARFSVYFTNRD